MASQYVYINGDIVDSQQATVSVLDRGLLFGDGVFEDIRIIRGRAFRLSNQLAKLQQYASASNLRMPIRPEELHQAIHDLVLRNNLRDGGARVILTRGSIDPPTDPRSPDSTARLRKANGSPHTTSPCTLIIFALGLDQFPTALPLGPIDIGVYGPDISADRCTGVNAIKRLRQSRTIAAIKTVLATGHLEALVIDENHQVLGSIYHAVFVIRTGTLIAIQRGVPNIGDIYRDLLLELADALQLPRADESLTLDDLIRSDECFLSGFATPVVPVGSVSGQKIGNGECGVFTRALKSQIDNTFTQSTT